MISFLSNILIILGVILFSYFSWRKINWGIYSVVFFLPLYLIKIKIFGIPSTALEIGIYLLFIIWLIKRTSGFRQNLKNLFNVREKLLAAGIFLLTTGVFAGTFFSQDIRTSAGILKAWFFDPLLLFIVLVSEIKTFEQKANILKALFLSGLAVALINLGYLFLPQLDGVAYDGRLHGFYLSANYLAMYLAPSLIIGIWLVCELFNQGTPKTKSSIFYRAFVVFSVALLSGAIYFTYSYAAWFAAAVSIFLMICLAIPPVKRKIFIGAVALIAFILLFSQNGTSKFENFKSLSYRSSFNSRLMIWRAAWEIGKDNFMIGIGPGNFQKYYLDYQSKFSEPYLEWAVPQPHNIFLAFWLQSGIAGFSGFIIILWWFFRRAFDLLKSNFLDKKEYLMAIALVSLMVYTIIHGFFDTTYWKNDLAIIFWLNLSLMYSIKKQPKID